VFQAELRTLAVANSSALGGALRAAQAVEGRPYAELFGAFSAPGPERIAPSRDTVGVYAELGARYAEKIKAVLG